MSKNINLNNLSTEDMQSLIEEVERRKKEQKAAKRTEAVALFSMAKDAALEGMGIDTTKDDDKPSYRERLAARLHKSEDETPEGALPDPA